LLFSRGEFVFGRGPECHVRPNSEWVSRQHCLLRVADDGVFIRDLASCNGTLVNGGRVVGERRLADGDLLQVGPLVFKLHLEDEDDVLSGTFVRTAQDTGIYSFDTARHPALAPAGATPGDKPQ
jgi:pSer/pThr/pTyr-binding forkhead associated (FHA) protein